MTGPSINAVPSGDFFFNDLEGGDELSDGALSNLQCNILRSTNRLRSTQVFRRFKTRADLLTWLASAPRPTAANETPDHLVNILFTFEGLSLLGVNNGILSQMDLAFQRGARHPRTLAKLLDRSPLTWHAPHFRPWHVVELHWHRQEKLQVQPSADMHVEEGAAVGSNGRPLAANNPNPHRYGHFRIIDGVSTTVYTQSDYRAIAGNTPLAWDPRHRLSTILVPDPLAAEAGERAFGSYFVFRKYEQDVDRFFRFLREAAQEVATRMDEEGSGATHRLSPVGRNYQPFGSLSVGDFRTAATAANLEALLLLPAGRALIYWIFGIGPEGERAGGGVSNNFDYANGSASGGQCPFSAHARKCNPRGSTGDLALERRVSVARRGISYEAEDDRGLLFWCAQSNIAEQFEYIQEKWANSRNVNPDHKPIPGVDRVIGRLDESLVERYQRWTSTTEIEAHIWDAVTHVASEYLYAPSLQGFNNLKKLGEINK